MSYVTRLPLEQIQNSISQLIRMMRLTKNCLHSYTLLNKMATLANIEKDLSLNIFYFNLVRYTYKYSQIPVIRTPIIRNYWVIRRRWTVPNFFSIIYCNKTTNYSNFDYPKNSIFRSDSSVPIEESAIKLPLKIRSPKVTPGDHDFFVWSSSIYTPE